MLLSVVNDCFNLSDVFEQSPEWRELEMHHLHMSEYFKQRYGKGATHLQCFTYT